MGIFGWSYPPGAANDPNAPYNQDFDDSEENWLETDPYGHLTYAIGTGDDFWCFDFDYNRHYGDLVRLHAVINSETGSFIMNAEEPIEVPLTEAVEQAQRLVDQAIDWCIENDVVPDTEGWNQQPDHSVKQVEELVKNESKHID